LKLTNKNLEKVRVSSAKATRIIKFNAKDNLIFTTSRETVAAQYHMYCDSRKVHFTIENCTSQVSSDHVLLKCILVKGYSIRVGS